jgi:hypothetical protein
VRMRLGSRREYRDFTVKDNFVNWFLVCIITAKRSSFLKPRVYK